MNFTRRIHKDEEAAYQQTMEQGFYASGAKERIAITHGSVFPAVGRDTLIGSPYGEGAREWLSFLKLNGFNGNQLGPNGALCDKEISPYNSSALNENPLFVDLKELTTEKYGHILPEKFYEDITLPIFYNDKNYAYGDQKKAKAIYAAGLHESYKNFKANVAKGQPQALQLEKEFADFKASKVNDNITKGKQTEEEGVFRVLTALNGTEEYERWSRKIDRNLMEEIRKNNPEAKARYDLITKKFKNSIEEYQFEQFIVTKQIKENKDFRNKLGGFRYFSDLLIGCSKMDAWRYKEAFLEGYAIGAYEHSPSTPHQTWGIPVLNPRKLFVGENGLNIGGQFLKEKIHHALENCENLRVDHALGLIDPFVYEEKSVKYDQNKKQIKHEIHGNYMSELQGWDSKKLDDYNNYQRILTKIVLPLFKEYGLEKEAAVWENICSNPQLFTQIYYNELKLPRLVSLDYEKPDTAGNQHWYLIGSHDTIPVRNMLDENGGWRRNKSEWSPQHLAGYLHQDSTRHEEKEAFLRKLTDYSNKEKMDTALVYAKFAELFTEEKIQVSFDDILGINEDGVCYNIGGSRIDMNWRERIAPDFLEKYYKDLSSDNPRALNIPEILKTSVKARIDMNLSNYARSLGDDPNKNDKITKKRTELHNAQKDLLERLEHWEKVLKEKEN